MAANVPRIDYDPATGKCLGLLVESTRTNTALNSDTFSSWTKSRSTVVDTTVPSPDPTKFAKKLVDNTELNEHVVNYAFTPAASTTYVFSCFLKAAERNFAFISIRNFANQTVGWSVSIDLTTYQTFGAPTSTAGETLTITPLPDGWCRVSLSTTTIAAPVGTINPTLGAKDSLTASGTYVGDGTSGIYIFGAQVEVGASPSSYIPTAGAAVTRAADLVSIDYTLPTVGAIVSSLAGVSSANSSNAYVWSAINPADHNADHAYFYYPGASQSTNWWVNKGGVGQSGGNVLGRRQSAGFCFDASAKTAAIASGSLLFEDTTRPKDFPSNLSQLLLGRSRTNANFLNGCISRLAVYSGRITNAQLQRLTA
ncbi:hypothetical protein P245_14380 [Comamonas thiooxydans]|uniref:Uncharacterized protein n=1 Tax=Comamonas thiooxydans TaxID=363952 RepID=A0A0E3BDA3_9BURK|nr:hypothetical protein P245_14380 [Comamonas thiooxydans]